MRDSPPELHVEPRRGRWVIVRAGDDTPLATFDRRHDAVGVAQVIAARESAALVVFDVRGEAVPPERWADD
jgi:hypothetical protein